MHIDTIMGSFVESANAECVKRNNLVGIHATLHCPLRNTTMNEINLFCKISHFIVHKDPK